MENLKISEPDHYNHCHRHHHCRHCRHLKLWLVRALEQGQPRAFNDRASIIPLWWLSSSSSPWRWWWSSSSSKEQFDGCPLRLELSSCNPPSCWLLFKQFKPELFPPSFLNIIIFAILFLILVITIVIFLQLNPPQFWLNFPGLSAISPAPPHNSLPPPPPKSWPFTFHSFLLLLIIIMMLPFSNFLVRLIKSVTNWRPGMPLIAGHYIAPFPNIMHSWPRRTVAQCSVE